MYNIKCFVKVSILLDIHDANMAVEVFMAEHQYIMPSIRSWSIYNDMKHIHITIVTDCTIQSLITIVDELAVTAVDYT